MAKPKTPEAAIRALERQVADLQAVVRSKDGDIARLKADLANAKDQLSAELVRRRAEEEKLQVSYRANNKLTNDLGILGQAIHILTKP